MTRYCLTSPRSVGNSHPVIGRTPCVPSNQYLRDDSFFHVSTSVKLSATPTTSSHVSKTTHSSCHVTSFFDVLPNLVLQRLEELHIFHGPQHAFVCLDEWSSMRSLLLQRIQIRNIQSPSLLSTSRELDVPHLLRHEVLDLFHNFRLLSPRQLLRIPEHTILSVLFPDTLTRVFSFHVEFLMHLRSGPSIFSAVVPAALVRLPSS